METIEELKEKIRQLEKELLEKEERYDMEIDYLRQTIDEFESEVNQLSTNYIEDSMKYELLVEHWGYITLEDIEGILKAKKYL
jgi:predicted  nucleic acid-binding Zn-ribbon protein